MEFAEQPPYFADNGGLLVETLLFSADKPDEILTNPTLEAYYESELLSGKMLLGIA